MTSITVTINHTDYRARILPTDEDGWRAAALRAIQRRLGRHAFPHRWNQQNWQQDDAGRVTREYMVATVVGREGRILGEARVILDHRHEEV